MLDTKDSDSQHYHIYEWLSTVHVKTRKTRPVAVLACIKPPQSSPGNKGKRPRTRPGAVLGCPGELEAQSRWVFKLARSSARCTPREGTKRENPGGRWAAARRRAAAALGGGGAPGGISIASRCCFPHGMQTRETHYLSASACQDVRNSARSHNKPEKPPQNRTPQDSKRNLEIQRNCKFFDLENYQKTRKSPSFVHFNGSKAIPERFDFAGVSPVSY